MGEDAKVRGRHCGRPAQAHLISERLPHMDTRWLATCLSCRWVSCGDGGAGDGEGGGGGGGGQPRRSDKGCCLMLMQNRWKPSADSAPSPDMDAAIGAIRETSLVFIPVDCKALRPDRRLEQPAIELAWCRFFCRRDVVVHQNSRWTLSMDGHVPHAAFSQRPRSLYADLVLIWNGSAFCVLLSACMIRIRLLDGNNHGIHQILSPLAATSQKERRLNI